MAGAPGPFTSAVGGPDLPHAALASRSVRHTARPRPRFIAHGGGRP